MATKTKTELKTDIATNQLTSQLMTDMVDSFSQEPDSNGNYTLGGSLPSDVYTAGTVIAYAENVFYVAQSNSNTFLTKNIYLTNSSTWKITGSGTVGFSVTQLGAGSTIEYHGEGTGGSTVTLSNFEKRRVDKNGNMAYNGASIPSDLDSDYQFTIMAETIIMVDGRVPVVDGITYELNNCYFKGSAIWTLIDSSKNGFIHTKGGASEGKYFIPSSTPDGNFLSGTKIYEQTGSNGNVNIKTGGTYTSTL